MNGQPKDPVEAAEAGRPLLSAVDGHKPGEAALVVKGADEMVARLDCSLEAKENAGWARALANRWNLHHDLADGLRRLVGAAQSFSGGRRSPTGDLEEALGAARGLLDRVDGRDRKAKPLPPARAPELGRISSSPEVLGGKPVVRGSRLAVEHVLGMLGAGDSVDDLLVGYPGLDREDVLACIAYGARAVRRLDPPVGFELRITMEAGVNPDDVARSVKSVIEQRLEALRVESRMDVEALEDRVAARIRALASALAVLFRALPQRYQPCDAPEEWEREFASGAVDLDGIRGIVEWATARAKAETPAENSLEELKRTAAELVYLLPQALKPEGADKKVKDADPGEVAAALSGVVQRMRDETAEYYLAEKLEVESSGRPPTARQFPAEVKPLWCPHCGVPHVDDGEWAKRIHREHLCTGCGGKWRIDPPAFGMPHNVATDEEIAALGDKIPDTKEGRAALQAFRAEKTGRRGGESALRLGASLLRQMASGGAEPHRAILVQAADELEKLTGVLQQWSEADVRAAKAEAAAENWERTFNMYRRAWIRELGGEGKIRPKAHEVDALVATTEALRLRAEAGEAGVRAELAELHARKEEASRLRRQVLELDGKLEGAAIRAAGAVHALADAGKLAAGVCAEDAMVLVRDAVMANLLPEHAGLLARLQQLAESAQEKLIHAQARMVEMERELRGARDAKARADEDAVKLSKILDAAWKATGVPVRGMVDLAEVVGEIKKSRDELLGMAKKALTADTGSAP